MLTEQELNKVKEEMKLYSTQIEAAIAPLKIEFSMPSSVETEKKQLETYITDHSQFALLGSSYNEHISPQITTIKSRSENTVEPAIGVLLYDILDLHQKIQKSIDDSLKTFQERIQQLKDRVLFLEEELETTKKARQELITQLERNDLSLAARNTLIRAYLFKRPPYFSTLLSDEDYDALEDQTNTIQRLIFPYQEALISAISSRDLIYKQLLKATPRNIKALIQEYNASKDTSPYKSELLCPDDFEAQIDNPGIETHSLAETDELIAVTIIHGLALADAFEARQRVEHELKNGTHREQIIATYEANKDKEPYTSSQVLQEDHDKYLKPYDTAIANAIATYKKEETTARTKLLAAKATPALTAMKTKRDELTTRFAAAKQQLLDKGDSQSSRVYNELLKASQAANSLYEDLTKLHQQFINVKIDLATFKDKSKALVAKTKWQNIEPAEKILAEHRRTATGGRTFKQMARDYLNSFGSLGEWLANSLFGKTKAHGTLYKVTEAIAKLAEPKKP